MQQFKKVGPLGGLFAFMALGLLLAIPSWAAGGWTRRAVDNLTLELPADWRPLSAKNLKESPFRAAWFTGDEEHPDAGVAIFRPSFMPNIRKKLAADKYTAATVGGRAARRYFIDFEGGGKSTSYLSIIAGAAPGSKDWALMHFAPTPKWPAHKATLERIIASVRFNGAAAPAPAKTQPKSAGSGQGSSASSGGGSPPASGSSGPRLFSAVKSASTAKFRGRPANHLRMRTTSWDKIPSNMAPVCKGTVTRRPGQKAFLAGDAAGKAGWSVDNFLLLTFSSSRGARRVVVGNADAVLYSGQVLPIHGPRKFAFKAGEVDLTDFLPENQPVNITAEALDYGGVGYVSDVYLVLSGGRPAAASSGGGSAAPAGGGYWRLEKVVGGPVDLGKSDCYVCKAGGHEGRVSYSIQNICRNPHGRFAAVARWNRPPSVLWPGKPFPITLSISRTAKDPRYSQWDQLSAALVPLSIRCGGSSGGQSMAVKVTTNSANPSLTKTKAFTMPDGGSRTKRLALLYCTQGWSQQYVYRWIPRGQQAPAVRLPPLPAGVGQDAPASSGGAAAPDAMRPGLRLDKSEYAPGQSIRVTFTAPGAYASNAWVGIIPSKVPHGKEAVNDRHDITYQYLKKRTSGVLVFKAPAGAGSYDLRMHDTDNGATGRETASVSFKVVAGSSSGGSAPATTPPAAGGSTTSTPATAGPAGGGYWKLVKITGAPRKLGTHQCYQYRSRASEGHAVYTIHNVCMKPQTRFSGEMHWQRPPAILYPGKPFSITLTAIRTSRDTRLGQGVTISAALEPERIPCGYTAGTSSKMYVSVGSGSAQDKVTGTKQFKMPDGGTKPRRMAWLFCASGWSQQYVYEWVPKGSARTAAPPTTITRGSSPVTHPPVTHPPVTQPPVTQPPVTSPPVTQPPVTSPPVTSPPPTAPPTTRPPKDYSRAVVIRPSKPVYRPDEPIVVRVSGLPAISAMHVSIGPAGTTEFKTNQSIKTNAQTEGVFTFKPRSVGRYRVMVWPDPNLMRYSILKTAEVEVKAPPLTAAIEQPKVEYNTGEKRIKITVRPDSLVFVPAMLVAVPRGAPSKLPDHGQVRFFKRFPGLRNLPMTVDAVVGLKPGEYEWRLYEPDTKGRVVARLPFTVVALGPDSPVPADMVRLPFSDRFSPGAECWRTEGLHAAVKGNALTVNTARKPLTTAFSIPLENVSVFFKFKAAGHAVRASWGAVKGQGYGLVIIPAKSGPAEVRIYADGMYKALASAKAPLADGAWHSVYLRRAGDDLELRIDGKPAAQAKTARRYKGGAPLVLQGGEDFTVKEVEVLYPNDAPHGGGYQKKDAERCRCGPRILENWLGGLQQHGWRMTSGPEPKLSHQFLKSETQVSGPRIYKGIRMLRVKAEAQGKGSCRPPSVRAVFKVGRANSTTAYLETFVVLGLGDGSHNFPHLLIELLDDQGKVLGSQRFYSPAAASQASRENAERRKYVKLTRSAGVVRLNLKDVKKDVEFSQVAVSLVNYVCDGDNDIAVDQILFCPSGDCGLTMTEVIDQARVLAEIERLFVDFEITAEELQNYYIVPPTVEPRPQPTLKPAGSSRLSPALYHDPTPTAGLPLKEGDTPCCNRVVFSRAAAASTTGGCDKAMDKTIKDMRRMQVSLGHDNQLKKALWDMAKTMVKDLDLGPGGIKKAQEWVGWAMDEGEFAYNAYSDVQAGKTKEAVDKAVMHFSLKAFQFLHKKLLDECQKGLQLKKFSTQMRSAWAKSLMKLPPAQRRAELARLKHVFGARLSDDEFHRWVREKLFGQVKGVDVGKAGGQAAGGQYKQALATIVSTTATAFSPQVRIAKAALTTYYESLRYMRDVITDDRTQDLYTAYRNWYDTSRGGQGLFDAHAMRDRYPLHKVRTLLAKQKGTTHDKVSDDEAWKYLMKQFGKWREAEVKAEQQSDTLTKLKARFQSLPSGCRRGLDKILWPQGKYGLTHEYRKRFNPCYYDVEALKAYGKLYRDIMGDLKTWARPNMKCGGAKFLDDTTARLACKFLTDGPEAYKRAMAHTLKSCDWLPKPKVVVLSANQARLAKRLTRGSETRLQALLRGIGREDLLGCLCGQGVLMGVAGGYKPMPLPDSPACKKVSNGLCAAGNWGCFRFPVPMTTEALKNCGVFEAIVQWQMQRRKARAGR